VIEEHLLGVRPRTLGRRVGEVGSDVVECGARTGEVATEPGGHGVGSLGGSAGVIVEEHKGKVVPVLRLASCSGGGAFREEEPGEPGHVYFGDELDPADARRELADFDVS
jgi:hypothetical protein